jgi:uncharacterized protein YdeI (YjbR/CyaY-like superfamily)
MRYHIPMTSTVLQNGTVHKLPTDLKTALLEHDYATKLWMDITPLARNEWICWVTSAKKEETRTKRIVVGLDKMRKGMRRPCCWAGCIHR